MSLRDMHDEIAAFDPAIFGDEHRGFDDERELARMDALERGDVHVPDDDVPAHDQEPPGLDYDDAEIETEEPCMNGDEPEPSAPRHQEQPASGSDANTAGDISDTAAIAPDGYRLTDAGNSRRLVDLCPGCFKYAHAWDRWLVYRHGVWMIDENNALITEQAKGVARGLFKLAITITDSKVREWIFRWAGRSESSGAIAAMVKLARGIRGVIVEHEELDADPDILNVANGTVDLRTGELRPHDPADLCTKQIDVDYRPDARASRWESCLETWQPDPEMRDYLQLEAGAATTGYSTEGLSVHYGAGANGKSRFWGAISDTLGDYATVPHKSLIVAQRHDEHGTETAKLFRKRLAVASETDSGAKLADEKVKNLTGNDRLTGRRMREDPWEFQPSHTLILFSNHKPQVQGQDEGIWRRLRLVPWTVTIPEPDRDEHLDQKLRHVYVEEAILAWIVAGARRYLTEGFTPPDAVRAATAEYRAHEDTARRAVTELLTITGDRGDWQWSADIIEAIDDWATSQGLDPPRIEQIADILRAEGCTSKRRKIGAQRGMTWSGMVFSSEVIAE